ncbi:MAG: hypothetical protein HY834_14330 [Devosia nanyangense]|uniref:Uncharacterized protein n=1 Tax=Devosia nanyangense TaxID=1228055 RepID=A0A933L3G0_9HYPH|nr:hypothetical protein [Devosia nanyangense]
MSVDIRTVATSGLLAAMVAGAFATPMLFPAAFADEPASIALRTASDLFPPPFDPKKLVKYDIVFDDTVSTEVQSTQLVKKIGYGQKTMVSIVTTPSGTYSSDALTSPNVRYPGIEVTPKARDDEDRFWISSFASPYGTGHSTAFSVGSFTYYTYSFKPRG